MIVAGVILSCYAIMAAIAWAWVAYSLGMHYGEEHAGERSETCQKGECRCPLPITIFCTLLWPLVILMAVGLWWNSLWNTAGANSKLPPENAHPTAKKKDPA